MDVQPTNLQQLCDAIMSIWTKISEEYFQHLVESMPRITKAVLKAKRGLTRYKQGVPNKVASECTLSNQLEDRHYEQLNNSISNHVCN